LNLILLNNSSINKFHYRIFQINFLVYFLCFFPLCVNASYTQQEKIAIHLFFIEEFDRNILQDISFSFNYDHITCMLTTKIDSFHFQNKASFPYKTINFVFVLYMFMSLYKWNYEFYNFFMVKSAVGMVVSW
jgi:hypothetical protein